MVARLPKVEAEERGLVQGRRYTNKPFGVRLEVPDGWKMDNSRSQSLVTYTGPAPEVRGALQRVKLPEAMGVQEFTKLMARQWGVAEASTREGEYPAGHGVVLQYGGNYMRFRTLLIVREKAGYTASCQIPAEQYYQYIVDCEKIMRSLRID